MNKQDFINKFLNTFAKNISPKELKTYRIGAKSGEFLWNLFAGKLIPCFSGNKARQEYDKANKVGAEEIQFSSDFIGYDDLNTYPLSDEHRTARDIDKSGLIEFYVIGKDFEWCYVVTHEGDADHIFVMRPNNSSLLKPTFKSVTVTSQLHSFSLRQNNNRL